MTTPGTLRVLWSAIALSLWLGSALLLAAAVAPAAFAALPTRALAGAVVGRVLPVVFVAGMVAGVMATALALSGPAPFGRARALTGGAVAAACAVAQFVIGPRIHRLRAAVGPSLDALAADDARRVEFGRLHGMSVAWMGVGMLAALVGLGLCVLALRGRSAA